MITVEHIQEGMSRSYVQAIAGSAGLNMSAGREWDYGFDGTFRPVVFRGKRRIETGFPIDFQLKCTKNWKHEDIHVSYSLESKTYNDLVTRDPRGLGALLILMCVPEEQNNWVTVCEDHLILKNCCYYTVLSGSPLPNEKSKKKILIPRSNILTALALSTLVKEEEDRKKGVMINV